MALKWRSVDDVDVNALLALAEHSWQDAELEARWHLTGWPWTDSKDHQGRRSWHLPVYFGPRLLLPDTDDDLEICSFTVPFAYFNDPDPEEVGDWFEEFGVRYQDAWCFDEDVDDYPEVHVRGDAGRAFGAGATDREDDGAEWRADPDAGRDLYDAAWSYGCAKVAARLGPPDRTDDGRRRATWRVHSRLLTVAQLTDSDDEDDEMLVLAVTN